ncbi:MAG: alpha/beta fold hydrolase [Burkholderiaceae bacterium]|nr:alpha/beta fold hydrolase [Burkholderiaceae bacterium]MCD8517530.1 alpha/beta fold hydrolase [Burkholderiaceae bacterium]MCD8537913.1 alpha/beta fold hydrolase [Burkholderiaceae bacterium]MCD8565891.1 alpha/beta fold hydrolase [Burkholderiaceae bacterium]
MQVPDQHFEIGEFELLLGGRLPNASLAYVTLGELNTAGDNAILILHGYTSSHRFVLEDDPDNAEGSWGPLIGPGKAIDTNLYFVIAPNALGSSYGSTGPGDINRQTGRRWGPEFPALTFEDQVHAQTSLLKSLGVNHLHAVIGLSMGGFGAFQWAVQCPTMMRKVIPVLTAPWGSLNQAASHQGVTAVLQASAAWHNGWYYDHLEQMQQTLETIRIKTLERYGVPAWLETELHDATKIQTRLKQMAGQWASKFDANAMLTLRAAINRFDVREALSQAQAELMYVLCRTDGLFPPSIAKETLDRWSASSSATKYVEIDSEYGHFASSLDWRKWANALEQFLTD